MNQYEKYISEIEQQFIPESIHKMDVFDDSLRLHQSLSQMKRILWDNEFKTGDPLHPQLEYPMDNFFVSDSVRRGLLPLIFPQLELKTTSIPQLLEEIEMHREKGEFWSVLLRYRLIFDIYLNEEDFRSSYAILIQMGDVYRYINKCVPAGNCYDLAIMIGKDYRLDTSTPELKKKENIQYLKTVFEKIHNNIMARFKHADQCAFKGNFQEAMQNYHSLIMECGTNKLWNWAIKASFNYASCLKAVGQQTTALEVLRAAIQIADMTFDIQSRMMILSQLR